MKSKKTLALIVSGLVVLSLCVGTSAAYAYLSAQTKPKQNLFTDATPSVDIEENSSGTPSSQNEIPHENNGAVKQVSIRNTGDIPVYVRVMLIPGWKATDGVAPAGDLQFGSAPQLIGNTLVMGDATLQLSAAWRETWIYDTATQTFYYKKSVDPGNATTLLLEKVLLPEDKATQAVWESFQVEVLTDTLQSEGGALAAKWPQVVLKDGALELKHAGG